MKKMMKKHDIYISYIKGLKDGIKDGTFSSRHEGQLEALRMVLGITRTEERKIMKELSIKIRKQPSIKEKSENSSFEKLADFIMQTK